MVEWYQIVQQLPKVAGAHVYTYLALACSGKAFIYRHFYGMSFSFGIVALPTLGGMILHNFSDPTAKSVVKIFGVTKGNKFSKK